MPDIKDTPKNLGYRMPAEWERHSSVWLSWPYDRESFPGEVLDKTEETYCEIISNLTDSEKVELLVTGEEMKDRAIVKLKAYNVDFNNVNIQVADYADVWFRDFGPSFIVNDKTKEMAMVNWDYNAYNRWPELLKDDKISAWMNEKLGLPCFKPGIVLEGGAIEVNGKGTLLTTEQCALNENRNKGMTKEKMEQIFSDYLGVANIIWLKKGLTNDHTDGHIDNIARFVNPTTIVYAWTDDESSADYANLKENLEILEKAKGQDGRSFNLIKMPLAPVKNVEGCNVSSLNFYIANKVVLVPVFGHNNDKVALAIIGEAFPGRKVAGINCADLIYGGGTIHCATREQPG
ncbi:MAG: agmatine deiminase family protein [Patescibacteria group bacterium]|jgi:agmatine deiminase